MICQKEAKLLHSGAECDKITKEFLKKGKTKLTYKEGKAYEQEQFLYHYPNLLSQR